MPKICTNLTLTKSYLLPSLSLTFASSVGAPEDGALFYVSEGLHQLADILLRLLLAEHANEELAILCK